MKFRKFSLKFSLKTSFQMSSKVSVVSEGPLGVMAVNLKWLMEISKENIFMHQELMYACTLYQEYIIIV